MSPPLFTRAMPPSHRSWHPSACHKGISWPTLSSHRSHSEPGPGLCQGLNPLNMTIVGSKNRHQDVLTRASEHWEKCEMKWARYFLINKKGNLNNRDIKGLFWMKNNHLHTKAEVMYVNGPFLFFFNFSAYNFDGNYKSIMTWWGGGKCRLIYWYLADSSVLLRGLQLGSNWKHLVYSFFIIHEYLLWSLRRNILPS